MTSWQEVSPLFYLYPGRPMEASFSYTRDNIPNESDDDVPIHARPQIPFNVPPRLHQNAGSQWPPKTAAVEPEQQIEYPRQWWTIPREPFEQIPGARPAVAPSTDQVKPGQPRSSHKGCAGIPPKLLWFLLALIAGLAIVMKMA